MVHPKLWILIPLHHLLRHLDHSTTTTYFKYCKHFWYINQLLHGSKEMCLFLTIYSPFFNWSTSIPRSSFMKFHSNFDFSSFPLSGKRQDILCFCPEARKLIWRSQESRDSSWPLRRLEGGVGHVCLNLNFRKKKSHRFTSGFTRYFRTIDRKD